MSVAGMIPGRAPLATGEASVAAFARRLLQQCRERDRVMGDLAGGEPTWEMLLHLLVKCEDGSDVSVPSLCLASGIPIATALRWLSVLEEAGKVLLVPGPTGRHQCHVELTPAAADQLRRLLISWMSD
jgi:DNA-binding transcriptional ArsR family regulator